MIPKTYRCVNRVLYSVMSMGVLAACAYTFYRVEGEVWANYQTYVALGAAWCTLMWGGYFWLLRYKLDELGVTQSVIASKSVLWAQVQDIQAEHVDQGGQARRQLFIKGQAGVQIKLSSDLLSLEDMEEIETQLQEIGVLDTPPPNP